jgi:hypothetical protein
MEKTVHSLRGKQCYKINLMHFVIMKSAGQFIFHTLLATYLHFKTFVLMYIYPLEILLS